MKRQKLIETFVSFLKSNDVAVFCGQELGKSAALIDEDGFYYADGSYGLGVALGIAMCTDKRVFVFCRDADVIGDLSVMVQMAASHQKNLFCVILNEGCYQEVKNQPTLTSSVYSIKGLLFNYGFLVHDYSHFFKGRINKKLLTSTVERLTGPMLILIDITKGINNIEIDLPDNLDVRMSSFILNAKKGTSLFRGSY